MARILLHVCARERKVGVARIFRGPIARHVLQRHDAQPSRHLQPFTAGLEAV
jgi:hypothetical protein